MNKVRFIFSIAMMLLFPQAGKTQNVTIGDLTYTLGGDTAIVTGRRAADVTAIRIPSTVTYNDATYKVTKIGDNAFNFDAEYSIDSHYNDIKSLTFDSPSNLHAIGYCAFEGCNLGDNEEIAIPDGVKTIGDGAFLWTKIRKIVIGEGVEWIGEGAFYDTTLESVTLPSTLKSIGNYAFMWSQITAITLPENIRSIGKFAFGCSDIESIHIPASLKYLGNGPFLFCMNLSNITVDDNSSLLSVGTGNDAGVLFNKDKTRLIFFPSKVDLSTRRYQYKLPNSVKEIGGAAFSGRYPELKSLVLPTNLELIDTCAFMTYNNTWLPLDELTIPAKAHIKIGSLPGHITKLYLMGKENLDEVRAGHAGLSFSVAGVNSTGYGSCPTTTVYVKPSMLDYYKPLEGYHADGNINKVTDTINRSLNYHLTTLCYDFDVDLTDAALANGAEAYIATEAKEGNFTDMDGNADKGNYMVMKKVDYLPSRTGDDHDQYTGVLIKGTAGSTISFKMGENDVYSSSQTLLADDNMLVGVPCYMYLNPKENKDGSEGADYVNYGLGDTDFQRYLNPGVIGVHKAYLRLPSGQSLKAKLNMMFVNPQTTSISSILDNGKGDVDRSEMWHDLQGRQISHPSVPGIYIKNGKKVVVRNCQ